MFVKTSDREISGAYLERPHNTFMFRFLSLLYRIGFILQKSSSALHFSTKTFVVRILRYLYSNQYRFSRYLGTKAFLEFSIFVVCLYQRKIPGCISLFCCTFCLYQFYSIYNCLVIISPRQISLVLKKFYTSLAF